MSQISINKCAKMSYGIDLIKNWGWYVTDINKYLGQYISVINNYFMKLRKKLKRYPVCWVPPAELFILTTIKLAMLLADT